ncbi:hypothetical protein ACVIQT_002519 [Bradyrhizobium diazoefficiens]
MLERIDKHRDEDAGLSGILPLRRGDVQPRVRNHGALRLLAVPAETRADGEGARECAHTRAGSYERTLQTKAGDVNLKVPKLRRQTFETAIIERYRRRESSVEEALIEMYLAGISVRRVEDITEALWGTRGQPEHSVEPEQEDLYQDRGVAESQDRRRASVSLPRRHRDEAQLGW